MMPEQHGRSERFIALIDEFTALGFSSCPASSSRKTIGTPWFIGVMCPQYPMRHTLLDDRAAMSCGASTRSQGCWHKFSAGKGKSEGQPFGALARQRDQSEPALISGMCHIQKGALSCLRFRRPRRCRPGIQRYSLRPDRTDHAEDRRSSSAGSELARFLLAFALSTVSRNRCSVPAEVIRLLDVAGIFISTTQQAAPGTGESPG